jgi:exopolysaccharide biosynthesis WecB/TagA/CpsF family protein
MRQLPTGAPLDVNIVSSRDSLRNLLRLRQRTIYSCLNGYTLRSLLIEHDYDDLLQSRRIAFVVDGMLALAHLRMHGISADRICGRDLLDEALALNPGPITVIGGTGNNNAKLLSSIREYAGREVTLLTPPMFQNTAQVHEFARSVGVGLASQSLVVVCIRSPLQDILSGALSSQAPASAFINVGAVLDDIANRRIRALRLFSRLGLESLYRMIVSPKRTWPKINAMIKSRIRLSNRRYQWHEL